MNLQVIKKILSRIQVKTVWAIVIGIILIVISSKLGFQAGIIPNTHIQCNAAVIAFIGAAFGPWAGAITALAGHLLGDALFSERIWLSWVVADTVYGFATGVVNFKLNYEKFTSKVALKFNINQFCANALAWIFVAPLLDIVIYSEPADVVFTQGVTAFAVNGGVTLVIGSLVLFIYSKILRSRWRKNEDLML